MLANYAAGVYGSYTGSCTAPALPVANLQEVTPGEAELWTTVLGTTAQPYTIRVERVTMTGSDPNPKTC